MVGLQNIGFDAQLVRSYLWCIGEGLVFSDHNTKCLILMRIVIQPTLDMEFRLLSCPSSVPHQLLALAGFLVEILCPELGT